MKASRQDCQRGRIFWLDTPGTGSMFVIADDGAWMAIPDDSAPSEAGFDWARRTVPGVLELIGEPVEGEESYSGSLEVADNGWRFTDVDGSWVELDRGEEDVPEPEPEPSPTPPPGPEPEPETPESHTIIVRVEQQPVFAVFEELGDAINLNDVARFVLLEDGRAKVLLKVTDIFVDSEGRHTVSGCGTVYLPEEQAKELWALLVLIGHRLPLEL